MQTRLARRALKNQPFSRLHQLLRWHVLIDLSIDKVLRNSGAKTPGIDGKTKNDYATQEQKRLLRKEVRDTLRHHTASPVRRIYIPKPHKPSEKRPLGIPNITDRVAQDVVRSILEPIYESKQFAHSYGFRPFRCTHHAIERIRWLIGKQQYHWVVEIDIKGFFDNVDHDVMLRLLSKDIHDRKLLNVIRSMLKAGLIFESEFQETDLGAPQGGIASPLLANIYLTELDNFIADLHENLSGYFRKQKTLPCFLIRYADDAVILCKNKEHAETLKTMIAAFLSKVLHLELSAEKTVITHVNDGFNFLGFHIKRWPRQGTYRVLTKPSPKAIQKFKRTMSQESRLFLHLPGDRVIERLNQIIRGFAEYFRRGNSKEVFGILDHYLWWLVLHRLRRATGQSSAQVAKRFLFPYNLDAHRPQYRKYAARNFGFLNNETGGVRMLDKLSYYKIEYPNKCSQRHPYVKDDRMKLEQDKKLRSLLKANQKRFLRRLFGGSNWLTFRKDTVRKQKGRCTACKRKLTLGNTHVYFSDVVQLQNLPEDSWNDTLTALCTNCFKNKRKFSRGS